MKRIIALVLSLTMVLSLCNFTWGAGDIAINATNFPDEIFRGYLATNCDLDKDGNLSSVEIGNIDHIDVAKMGITSLEGIEHFAALKSLHCYNNQLAALDISENLALTRLWCGHNQLTELDVSKNTALEELDCSENPLAELDVSKNTALTELDCNGSGLTELDVSKNTALQRLGCIYNQLTALDVSKNTALASLLCFGNQLEELDVSRNSALKELHCGDNCLTELNVSKNSALEELDCGYNRLTELDVSQNAKLLRLYCYDNQLMELDVSKNSALKELACTNNRLTALDISQNTELTTQLLCGGNQLTSLDLSSLASLTDFDCTGNRYGITLDSNNTGDLSQLPEGFNVAMASNWTNATVSDNTLTVSDTGKAVTYDYDCGNGKTATFTLTVSNDNADSGIIELPFAEWDVSATLVREEDSKKQTFATYTIKAVAKRDGVDAYWTTVTEVKKGDVFEIAFNGETEFVEVGVEEQADVVAKVLTDTGRYTRYYAVAKDYDAGYETVANGYRLYPLPANTDDCTCYLQYSSVVDEVTDLYTWQDVWYMPDVDGTVIIQGGGKAVKANVIDTPDIIRFEHSYVAELDNGSVTKVYCSRCEESFDFIIGDEADAILASGRPRVHKSVAAETGVDRLWILRHDMVESAFTGEPAAKIGDKYYWVSEHGNISVVIRDFAKPGDTVVQVWNTQFASDAEVAAGVTFVVPGTKTLTTEGDLGAEKGARIACGGTIVVGANSTVDLHNLTRQAVLKDFIGDVTIKADGLVVLPDDWGGSNWDPNKDAELLAMLKDCENGALLRCGDTTWEQVAKDQWVKIGGAEAEVVAPTVESNINTDKIKDAEEKAAVEAVVETLTQPDAVQFDEKANAALSEAAAKVAENDNVKVTTDKVEALADTLEKPVAKEDVIVVVQTNFDVKIEEVSVDKKSGDATIKLDITPVYQHVATTKDVVESGADIKVGENAVTVSKKPQKVTQKITESVSITIAIPDVLIEFAQKNDNKLYVTHKKTNGTKFVYEAQVDVANKTATFINPNGFSEFVISVEDTTAAEISGMKYADLQSAIDNAGKDAVITVKVSDQQAVVSSEMTFKLVYEGDAKAENTKITAASGYKLSGPDKNGVYTVTKVSYGQGGYYPSISITPDTTDKTVTSPKTFDVGIGLYVGMGIISLTGSAWLMRKKEK